MKLALLLLLVALVDLADGHEVGSGSGPFHVHTHFSGPHEGRVRPGAVAEEWGRRKALPTLPQGSLPDPQAQQTDTSFLSPSYQREVAWPYFNDYSPNFNLPGRSYPLKYPAYTDANVQPGSGLGILGQARGEAQQRKFLDPVEAYEAAGNIRRLNGDFPHYHDKWGRQIRYRGPDAYPFAGRFSEENVPRGDGGRGFRDFFDPDLYPLDSRRTQQSGPSFDSRRGSLTGNILELGEVTSAIKLSLGPQIASSTKLDLPPPIPSLDAADEFFSPGGGFFEPDEDQDALDRWRDFLIRLR